MLKLQFQGGGSEILVMIYRMKHMFFKKLYL